MIDDYEHRDTCFLIDSAASGSDVTARVTMRIEDGVRETVGVAIVKPRPSFETIYMNLAVGMSARSTCRRLAVGCVITTPDFRKVLSVGYNGNVTGLRNDCDRYGAEAVGNCGCLHAEENAVINADCPRGTQKVVFCTHLPCVMCAKRLINLGGVQNVYYLNDYRIKDSLELFSQKGIGFEHFLPEDLEA